MDSGRCLHPCWLLHDDHLRDERGCNGSGQDISKVTQIDAPAAFPSPASTRELFQAELVSQYLSSTFTAHAGANTSVVFAFELAEDRSVSTSRVMSSFPLCARLPLGRTCWDRRCLLR